jgi:hypothetical protein
VIQKIEINFWNDHQMGRKSRKIEFSDILNPPYGVIPHFKQLEEYNKTIKKVFEITVRGRLNCTKAAIFGYITLILACDMSF